MAYIYIPQLVLANIINYKFGSKTRYLAVTENWMVFENILLKRLFGPRSEEVLLEWGKLHNEKFHNLFLPFKKYLLR
jgi:hypothetical protein